ncbi:peptidoglycan DD-metalloendopeptidase family protein [Bdellovibrionota bacterium FG-1]
MNRFLRFVLIFWVIGLLGLASWAAPSGSASHLADRLSTIRSKVVSLEGGLIASLKSQKRAQSNVRKIRELMALQKQERELGKKRLGELEATVIELEARRATLGEKVKKQQASLRRYLVAIEHSAVTDGATSSDRSLHLPERERFEAPRRKVLANLVDHGLKEIEALKVDVGDAEQLEIRIQDEKQQLAYLFQDLKEQEGIMELNRQLQADIIQKKHDERIAQLENYRKLKSSEQQVESLIGQFNARLELERSNEAERQATRAMNQGVFARLKGQLPLPVADGRIVSSFGRGFDPTSRLYIFKKGIEIATARGALVRAISAGKIAYSGELPHYGRVTIIDHGEHFYSLCAHLGELKRKAGDSVTAGDPIGTSDESGNSIYFEIRARNVAVNPLQWVVNSFNLNQ